MSNQPVIRRRTARIRAGAIGLAILAWSTAARAQTAYTPQPDAEDHTIVYELGWAGSWSRGERWQTRGGTVAFEVSPIEHWLELEAGATAIVTGRSTETSVDLLFKKPWTWSRQVEFMAGLGPEVVHADGQTFWGFSVVGDLMFWPKRNVGWYLEPGYERTFPAEGAHGGFAFAGGLIIGR